MNIVVVSSGNILDIVPTPAKNIINIDVKQILESPLLKNLELENYGFEESEIPTSIIIFQDEKGSAGVLIETAIPEEKFKSKVAKALKGTSIDLTPVKIDERNVYILKTTQDLPSIIPLINLLQLPDITQKEIVLSYIQPDLILLTDRDSFSGIIESINNPLPDSKLISKIEKFKKNTPCWGVFQFNNENPNIKKDSSIKSMITNGINGVTASINFTNKDKNEINVQISIDCADQNNLAAKQMQLNVGKSLLTLAFHDKPQLGVEVLQAIKINTINNTLLIDISFNKSLIEKLNIFTNEQTKKIISI